MSPSPTEPQSGATPRRGAGDPSPRPAEVSPQSRGVTAEANAGRERGTFDGIKRLVLPYVKRHPRTVLYGFIGFLIAVLILVVGFWPTLLLVIGVALGVLVGSYRDGNRKVRVWIKSLFDRMR